MAVIGTSRQMKIGSMVGKIALGPKSRRILAAHPWRASRPSAVLERRTAKVKEKAREEKARIKVRARAMDQMHQEQAP